MIERLKKMDRNAFMALRAKIALANGYLEQVMKHRKIDNYDIRKVVTQKMREFVEVVSMEQAQMDGLGIVRLKEAV
jgi:hypothetical protein